MSIRFLCPNGHKIQCPDEQAGKAAKCPRCGVKFRVPDLDELKVHRQAAANEATDQGPTAAAESASTETTADASAVREEPIEFLCPNGHRLHGPMSLQGQPGQCPECKARFRIPSYDEVPEEEEEDVQRDLGVGRAPGEETGDDDTEVTLQEVGPGPRAPTTEALAGLAELFPRLWAMRSGTVSIELHLKDGQTLKPERFAPELSRGSHGVFSLGTLDGSHTLAAVAWDQVVRVLMRGIEQLPEEMHP